jgi:hypothetical protein
MPQTSGAGRRIIPKRTPDMDEKTKILRKYLCSVEDMINEMDQDHYEQLGPDLERIRKSIKRRRRSSGAVPSADHMAIQADIESAVKYLTYLAGRVRMLVTENQSLRSMADMQGPSAPASKKGGKAAKAKAAKAETEKI